MTTSSPIRARGIGVVLVEDDAPTRDHLADAVRSGEGLELLAAVDCLEAARSACERLTPTVLLTDLKLPDGHGTDLIREVRDRFPATEIMVISVLGDEDSVVGAIRAGASAYILKDAEPLQLVSAIHGLMEGRSPISAGIARYIIRSVQGGSTPASRPATGAAMDEAPPRLTPRELDILWGIAKGFTNNAIADRLEISRLTVSTHVKSIYRKLQVNSRCEAVYAAVEHKLIKLGS